MGSTLTVGSTSKTGKSKTIRLQHHKFLALVLYSGSLVTSGRGFYYGFVTTMNRFLKMEDAHLEDTNF